jgi:hypothetical protein
LAVNASKQINLSEDEGYVKQSTEKDENEDFI